MRRRSIALTFLALAVAAPALAAESILDRRIGPDKSGVPVVIQQLGSLQIGQLAAAAGMPMGIELVPGPFYRPIRELRLTGLTVRDALRQIQQRDSRYTWREMDGVVVLRPRTSWSRHMHPLGEIAPAVAAEGISARHALRIACDAFGTRDPSLGHGDTQVFDLRFEAGTTMDLLNAVVRAHGQLVWVFEQSLEPSIESLPYSVSLMSGGAGMGCGTPGRSSSGAIELVGLLDDLRQPGSSTDDPDDLLDRLVSRPITAAGMYDSAISSLASAVRVPFGLEQTTWVPPIAGSGVKLTGMKLRDALDALVAIDPRYSWRLVDGVVVIRPRASWGDSANPLFAPTPPIELKDASLAEAVGACLAAFGRNDPVLSGLGDSRTITLDLPAGAALDLLNAISRVHGELSWFFKLADADDQRRGFRYLVMFQSMSGSGGGFLLR